MPIVEFRCHCGNANPKKVIEYDGSLGYEALICKECGSFSDHDGIHPPDSWSMDLAGP